MFIIVIRDRPEVGHKNKEPYSVSSSVWLTNEKYYRGIQKGSYRLLKKIHEIINRNEPKHKTTKSQGQSSMTYF